MSWSGCAGRGGCAGVGGALVRGGRPADGGGAALVGLVVGLVVLVLGIPQPARGQEVVSSLGVAFVGVDGFEEWASGVQFAAALRWGPFWLFDFQAVEKLRAFGLHAGWKVSPAWLAVGVRIVQEEQRSKTKTIWQVGARAGGQFRVLGVLSWYNEAGVYAPLGERGDLQPFVSLGFSLTF